MSNGPYFYRQHGPYKVFQEDCGWYTFYSIVNSATGFAILQFKVSKV